MTRVPTVHFNGSDARVLLEGYRTALRSIHDLEEKLSATAPNHRDYYPQPAGEFEHASNEHRARLASLARIRVELQDIVAGIIRGIRSGGLGKGGSAAVPNTPGNGEAR